MQKHPRITRTRVRRVLERHLRQVIYTPSVEFDVAAHHVRGEPIPAAEAFRARYEPFPIGGEWGGAWNTTWFRLRGRIPKAWAGREVSAVVWFARIERPAAGEGLIWRDKLPVQAIDRFHNEYVVTSEAAGGDRIELFLEAAANPQTPNVLHPPLLGPEPEGSPLLRLRAAHLAVANRDFEAFFHDFRVAFELCDALGDDNERGADLLYALNAACNELDLSDVLGSWQKAHPIVRDVLDRPATASAHTVSAVGHAHIDSAWLWPRRETIRKCARTFATATTLMDDYPEYRFVCSQAAQYQWMKDHYPHLFERIKEKVAAGQWEPVGSMWVETDCNVPSGESLVRQILLGKRFFRQEFGVETTDLWLPDVFGYSAAIPQILALAGIDSFLTQKISWNQLNRFPHHTFQWEGIDGTRVFTHFPPADTYNGNFTVAELRAGVDRFLEHGRAGRSLYVYGYGDGGGGPTREMLESSRRVRDVEGLPRVELEPARAFFEKAKADAKDLPVWVGELYLEFHRGTYTTQAKNKLANRRSELLLREAELWSVATPALVASYKHDELDEAWKLVCFNQFHDIIPGSSINWVYEDSDRDYARVEEIAQGIVARSSADLAEAVDTQGLSRPLVVLNAATHERGDVAIIRDPGDASAAAGPDGHVSPLQKLEDGSALVWAHAPGLGYASYDLIGGSPPSAPGLEVEPGRMENAELRVEWDEDGLLTSLYDKRADREVLAGRANVFQLHPDYPNDWDAWDVDAYYKETVEDLTSADSVEIVESGPVRAAVRVVRRFGSSMIRQEMRLAAGSRVVEFDTHVDWQEDHRFLKVAFPVDIHAARATYEIQFGHVERPTHTNTSWDLARFEVCAQKWAHLGEPGYGVALLNDCKYGHDIQGNVMRLSLLRAPTWPDPRADRGEHRFRYGLYPHAGDLQSAGVVAAAQAFNMPLRVVPVSPSPGFLPEAGSVVSVSRPGVVVESVKRAEDGDQVVVRLYEAHGGRGEVEVSTLEPAYLVTRCDLLERGVERPQLLDAPAVRFGLRPFEIVTLKFDAKPPTRPPARRRRKQAKAASRARAATRGAVAATRSGKAARRRTKRIAAAAGPQR